MNYIDILIIIFAIAAIFRGKEIGFLRQFFSTAGFFGGLVLGALLQPHTITWVQTELSKALLTLLTTLGSALLLMSFGEILGIRLKRKLQHAHANKADNALGSILAIVSLLLIVWLSANIFASLPASSFQTALNNSRILTALTNHLPPAPTVIAKLSRLIDPNGFPQVFTGREPTPGTTDVSPTLDGFNAAITATQASVVKLEGQGCGGIVEGSGFVVADSLVATNAHVIAGTQRPYVTDVGGTHQATPIWFNPDLDFAVLRVTGLAGKPLSFDMTAQSNGTKAAILGYPGGGAFDAESAVILDQFIAIGRNIYGRGETERDIYEVKAHIIPGNSGGPMINKAGNIIGIVFAQSTSYENVGYTLTAQEVMPEINAAKSRATAVGTGSCAE